MAAESIGLVYGGGGRGLMGTVARTVLQAGGRVTGIIPDFLTDTDEVLREAQEQEPAVLRGLIEEGNACGCLHVENPHEASRLLKTISLNYMPGYPAADLIKSPSAEIEQVMDMVYRGLR